MPDPNKRVRRENAGAMPVTKASPDSKKTMQSNVLPGQSFGVCCACAAALRAGYCCGCDLPMQHLDSRDRQTDSDTRNIW
jgi:hypothetical protein